MINKKGVRPLLSKRGLTPLIISGPTACGKSALALKLGEIHNISIINADSLQIYQGLPILSAQPFLEEQEKVKHFLYSYLKPHENCSVALWLELVKSSIEQSWQENKLPIIVGGSGMYISKLVDGISPIPEISTEAKIAAKELYEKIGHAEFKEKFGENKIIDKHRLLRAAEVLIATKKPISFWQKQPSKKIFPNVDFMHININPNREKLYQNCNLRFEKMLKNGAIEEVKNLISQGVDDKMQITKTLGFAEICDFLANKISQEKMIEIASQKTRNYAKRQLTWFRNQLPNKRVFSSESELLQQLYTKTPESLYKIS